MATAQSLLPSSADHAAGAVREHLLQLRRDAESAETRAQELWASVAPTCEVDSVVELNVGGDICFTLTRDQFSFLPGSLLEALTSERWDKVAFRDKLGRVFLDVDPAQFRAVLDWVFEAAQANNRPALPTSPSNWLPEPQQWGMELFLQLLGLQGREELIPDQLEKRIDFDDGKAYTFKEVVGKYLYLYNVDEISEYWRQDMQQCNPKGEAPTSSSSQIEETENDPPLSEASKCGTDEQLAALVEDQVRATLAEGKHLQERLKTAEEEIQRFHTEKQGLDRLFGGSTADEIIYLNAGGRVMATTKATLTQFENSMLSRWFGGPWTLQQDDLIGGAVRIKHDSETFAAVLQVLRFNRMFGTGPLPSGYPCRKAKLPVLRQVLSYFQIEPAKGAGKVSAKAKGKGYPTTFDVPGGEHTEHVHNEHDASDTDLHVNPGVRQGRPDWQVAVAVAL